MRPAEKTKGKPGRPRPAIFRVYSPKASARKLHQRIRETKNPSTELTAPRGVRRFSGASSVASALGIRLGATPGLGLDEIGEQHVLEALGFRLQDVAA